MGNEAAQMRAEEVIGEIAIVIAPLVEKLGIENKTVKKTIPFLYELQKNQFCDMSAYPYPLLLVNGTSTDTEKYWRIYQLTGRTMQIKSCFRMFWNILKIIKYVKNY